MFQVQSPVIHQIAKIAVLYYVRLTADYLRHGGYGLLLPPHSDHQEKLAPTLKINFEK